MQQSKLKIKIVDNSDVITAEWWAVEKREDMGSVNDGSYTRLCKT
jgi:hypothetical protein